MKKLSAPVKFAIGIAAVVCAYWAYQNFGTATVAITSEPTKAVVTVDGRQRGITPIERLELDAGTRRIVVEHSHYAPHVETLSVRRGDHETRHVAMQPGIGKLVLLSNPRGAWVEVDGERLDSVTPTEFETVSGPHLIRMGQSERHIVEEEHVLKTGENLEVNLNLNIDPHGSLTMVTVPRNAKIEFVGEDIQYEPKLRIRIGEYAIRVSKPGYKSQEFRYKVRYGENLHTVELQRDYGQLVVNARPSNANNVELQVSYLLGGTRKRVSYAGPMRLPVGKVDVRARSVGYRTEHKSLYLGAKGATVNFSLQKMRVNIGSEIVDKLRSGGQAPTMVVVPAGSFTMGDANGSFSEKPARTVTITQPFAVAKYEVSVGDYLLYTQAQGKSWPTRVDAEEPAIAMSNVTFRDAADYARWLSKETGHKYRLLSEAEWEYVARAGSSTDFFFGNDPEQLCQYANVADQSAKKAFRDWDVLKCDDGLIRVGASGRYQPNPFGIHDIYGNVSEWVLDCGMLSYEGASTDGSPLLEGEGCESHAIRGASWDSMAVEAKSAYRNTASSANDDRGIRLMREL